MRRPRLPDILTTANLSCGVGSILLASQGQLTWACWLVFAGAAFDVLDGLAARAFGGGSEFGKQLDSLADMVTFGVAPMFLIHGRMGSELGYLFGIPLHYLLFAIPIASAWRLANFNIDSQQQTGFRGLATPANALFWSAFVLASLPVGVIDGFGAKQIWSGLIWGSHSSSAVLAYTLVLASLMISSIPLPSLKFKHFKWRGNEVVFLLLGIGLVLALLYGILAVPLILLLYLLSPLWGGLFPKQPA